ncbi:hypothetical protein SDC9_04082 [bioreactor metagenome]|uniref:Spo0E like sporulation regulatory protein n=1 Tax=bioreactor metagenome TaxID=1076179 RepID=A0A644SV29_9ZZZZ|nr:aspartyl-phosphate phosphatase Spo0E family protein [Negativicutes bacterium]
MADVNSLKVQIEELREKLHQLVIDKKGNFVDHEVAQLSAQLDELIVAYEKVK